MNVKYGYTPNKNYIVDIDMTNKSIVEIIVKISEACKIVDEHLITKLKELINKTGSHLYDNRAN